jgi:hypothetical protein
MTLDIASSVTGISEVFGRFWLWKKWVSGFASVIDGDSHTPTINPSLVQFLDSRGYVPCATWQVFRHWENYRFIYERIKIR